MSSNPGTLEGTTALVSDRYLITCQVDSGQTVNPGQVVYISNPGFIPLVTPTAGASNLVIGVALTGGSAGASITVICRGLVRVTTSSTNGGVVSVGQKLVSDANGCVQGVATIAAPASYTQSAMQTELILTEQWIGRALTASSVAGTVIYALIWCQP